MSGPDKKPNSTPAGGRAAERLREFLRERLPSGTSAEELNPDAGKNKDNESSSPNEEKPDQDAK
jgi:hypothetical protein